MAPTHPAGKRWAIIALGAVLSMASSPVLAQSPAAQRGLTFVRVHCAQCHAVDKVSDSSSGSIRIRSRTSLHICRHSSPDGTWLNPARAPFREPVHLTENRLEFDLDQDLGLRSAQQYKRPNGRRIMWIRNP